MKLIVYIDVYFLMNGVFDFCILLLVGRIQRRRQRLLRLLAGAAAGGLGAAIVLVFSFLPPSLLIIWQYGLLPVLILVISFGFSDKKSFFHQLLTFYAITLFLGGIFVFFRQEGGKAWQLLSIMAVLEAFLWLVLPGFLKRNKELKNEYEVALLLGEGWVHGRALLDTGNRLYDPISKKPVVLAEFEAVREKIPGKLKYLLEQRIPMTGEGMEKIRWIPYHAVGTACGMIPGIEAKELKLWTESGSITKEDIMLGLVFEPLAVQGEYQFILHEDIIC